jgi:hypothetical protein
MVLFTNNRKIGGFYIPRLFGIELRMTDQVKYLGVILDENLDWKLALHIGSVAVLWERLGDWLSPKVVAWLFTSVVRLILSYASLEWWKRVELKNAQKKLSNLQQMTCLGIIGGMRSTPTST